MASPDAPLNVLLVDDEIEACRNLKTILLEYIDPDINIVGIAHNTAEAEQQLEKHNPDAVFLDIEMPNENAFQFLERVSPIHFEVIFVTAYDEYAIKAFKLNAVDYILKPISISELSGAVAKLKDRLKFKALMHTQNSGNDFSEISKQINSKSKLNRITLKGNNTFDIVDFKDVVYVEALGKYSKVFFVKNTGLAEVVTSFAISDYEEMLPTDSFYRIHKSYLINCDHIKQIQKDEASSIKVYDKIVLPISRRRFTSLMEFLQTKSGSYE